MPCVITISVLRLHKNDKAGPVANFIIITIQHRNCIKSRYSCKNKIEDNQHRGQVKKMEMGRTYPTNGQEQQM